ncbi:hypothetical protein EDD18DRAFT_1355505 [Armillaria luteobubalina]|uniref:Uncharacterized protein n=1 Tax=Armillaria luteobubalina TaxID=153913 RepID=A0AA39UV45_9AGAR|nr:hypothetical protein EDD18DRAFT_1355505 [Armillaria luteobubalina]
MPGGTAVYVSSPVGDQDVQKEMRRLEQTEKHLVHEHGMDFPVDSTAVLQAKKCSKSTLVRVGSTHPDFLDAQKGAAELQILQSLRSQYVAGVGQSVPHTQISDVGSAVCPEPINSVDVLKEVNEVHHSKLIRRRLKPMSSIIGKSTTRPLAIADARHSTEPSRFGAVLIGIDAYARDPLRGCSTPSRANIIDMLYSLVDNRNIARRQYLHLLRWAWL